MIKNLQNAPVATLTVGQQTMRFLPAASLVGAMVLAGNANAAEFSLDLADLITNVGVVMAAVTAVGLSALSLALTVKAFGYVKRAF